MRVDLGFVFAMSMEAAGLVDLLEGCATTKGNGRVFHTGKLKNRSVAIVESGIGQDKATLAVRALLDIFCPAFIISAGYAGGLAPDLQRFSVHQPDLLLRKSDGMLIDIADNMPKIIKKIHAVSSDSHFDLYTETNNDDNLKDKLLRDNVAPYIAPEIVPKNRRTLVTVDQPVETTAEKLLLGEASGAKLVDMETFAIAKVCCDWWGGDGSDSDKAVRFSSVRVILDATNEELPKEVKRIVKSHQSSTAKMIGTTIGSFFRRPSIVFDLYTLKEHALQATDILAKHIMANIVYCSR